MEQKDRLSLYKEFYRQELSVRAELDSSVNIPIVLLSAIVGLHVYVFTKPLDECTRAILIYVAALSTVAILVAVFFLGRSFTNLGRAYIYEEVPGMDKYLEYYKQLQQTKPETTKNFAPYLEEKFAQAAGKNFEINKSRRSDIADAKRALFWGVVFSIALAMIFIININKMADNTKNETKDTVSKLDIVTPPQNVDVKSHVPDLPKTIISDLPSQKPDTSGVKNSNQ